MRPKAVWAFRLLPLSEFCQVLTAKEGCQTVHFLLDCTRAVQFVESASVFAKFSVKVVISAKINLP